MRLPKYSQPPYSVSSDFGQLVGIRHLISGIDCAIAGAATAVEAASPTPADFRNSRRFILRFPCWKSALCRHGRGGFFSRLCFPAADERLDAILRNCWRMPNEKPGAETPGLYKLRAERGFTNAAATGS